MYKISSALFLSVVLLGAGCTQTSGSVASVEEPVQESVTADQPSDEPTEPLEDIPEETLEPLAEGEIGFTVAPSEEHGVFSVLLYKISRSTIGEDWAYHGLFSQNPRVIYRATHPEHVIPRGGHAGDVLGYEKKEDGYYIRLLGRGEGEQVPEALLVGEVPTANGNALILKAPELSVGPSIFPNEPGQLVAYLNTPNGVLPGGVFMTNPAAPGLTIEELKEILALVSVK